MTEAVSAENCAVSIDVREIMRYLPHRYPFLLIDKIIHLDETTVTGVKNVTMNEPFFQGHFPGNPVLPGVIQIEAMAQTGGILVLNTVENPEDYWTYFLGIDRCRFKRKVITSSNLPSSGVSVCINASA